MRARDQVPFERKLQSPFRRPWERRRATGAEGFTLIETACAAAVLTIVLVGVASLFATTFKSNFWQGDTSTRSVEYAQDKMESLLALSFSDSSTDTSIWPYCSPTYYVPGTTTPACLPTANQTGLSPTPGGATASLTAPLVSGYYDYLSATGDVQTTALDASYIRIWSIVPNASGTMKTITVIAASLNTTPRVSTTLVCIKTNAN